VGVDGVAVQRLPGFRADPYPEYSEVFFGGDYRVLRGGSFATSALVATPTFRKLGLPEPPADLRRPASGGGRMSAGAIRATAPSVTLEDALSATAVARSPTTLATA